MFGARLPFTYDNITPYFTGELGYEIIDINRKKSLFEQLIKGRTESLQEDFSFRSRIGLGLLILVQENISIDFVLKYGLSDYEYSYQNLYDFSIGFIYHIK